MAQRRLRGRRLRVLRGATGKAFDGAGRAPEDVGGGMTLIHCKRPGFADGCGYCWTSYDGPICEPCFRRFQQDFKRVAAERDAALAELKRLKA